MSLKRALAALAAMCGAVCSVWGAFALGLPVLRSDPPPFVGRTTLEQYAQTIQQLQSNNARLQAHQESLDQNVDMIRLEQLEAALDHARQDLAKNPGSTSARHDVCAYVDQADKIRARNGLPLIPPCQ